MIEFDGRLDPRAKVRIGEKRQARNGNSYPSALDYFISEDPELEDLHGRQPRRIPVRLAGDTVEDVFPTTLEWWGKKERDRATLVCYTKDAKTAHRLEAQVDPDDEKIGGPRNGRQGIACRFRKCPRFHAKGCRPMGRLDFFLAGGRQDLPLRFETKSFNTIEAVLPFLKNLARQGPLSAHVLDLCVRIEKNGDKQYPVVWLEPQPRKSPRDQLIALMELSGIDPRDPKVVARVKEIGVEASLKALQERSDV